MRGGSAGRTRTTSGVDERLLDRLDPLRKLDRLWRFLWHRERFATLRGHLMLLLHRSKEPRRKGLAGVNVINGRTEREVRLSDLDGRFVTDEALGLMFVSSLAID